MSSRTKVIAVTGAMPGVGKTTLSRRLAATLEAGGRTVELFKEEDILDRGEFNEVISAFRSTGRASLRQLVDGSRRHLQRALESGVEIVVQDMLFPFLPSLLAWGYRDDEVIGFFADLAACCQGIELVQVHITGDAATSLARAVSRECDGWLEWFVAKVATYGDTAEDIHDVDSVVRYLESAARRTEHLLARAPWRVVFVDSDLGGGSSGSRSNRSARIRPRRGQASNRPTSAELTGNTGGPWRSSSSSVGRRGLARARSPGESPPRPHGTSR